MADQRVSLGVNYSPFKHLTCHLGALYYFFQELSLLEHDGDTLEEIKVNDSFGGTFALHYNF
jgi:long-subunit fatty acid transport protein